MEKRVYHASGPAYLFEFMNESSELQIVNKLHRINHKYSLLWYTKLNISFR